MPPPIDNSVAASNGILRFALAMFNSYLTDRCQGGQWEHGRFGPGKRSDLSAPVSWWRARHVQVSPLMRIHVLFRAAARGLAAALLLLAIPPSKSPAYLIVLKDRF